ncbi:MAG: carbohydrate-binding domain-containing protein [Treponema sp.]|nr:carbohydrate-binding domain-containing protein [Treponema sp.]
MGFSTLKMAAALFVAGLCAFAHGQGAAIDIDGARQSYGRTLTITPSDRTVTIAEDRIVIAPKKEDVTYTISGYFNGQIVSRTKNTVLKFSNAFIENDKGLPAVYCEAKTEISTAAGTVNYVVSSGDSSEKAAAIHGKKNMALGGSGTLYAVGRVYHGIKADDVKIKGSGNFYLQGTDKGSALNCRSLTVEKGKTFKAYFLNSKNGVKADDSILIQSGSFFMQNLGTAFKTDTKEDAPKTQHFIRLTGGSVVASGVKNLHKTEGGAWQASGASVREE